MEYLKMLTNCIVHSTVEQHEDEENWLIARTKGIGGSDVGPICGVSPFSSARQVYFTKTGQYEEAMKFSDASKERMHFGHMLEPVVAEEYKLRTNKDIVVSHATLSHRDYPWALANIDRLIVKDGKPYGILECKTAGEYMNDHWADGDLPLTYIYQLNWYLWVLDLEYGAFACLVGGNKFYYYEMYRNDELLQNEIIPKVKDFWFNNVLALNEPEMQAADTPVVNEMFAEVIRNSEIVLDDDTANDLANTVFDCKIKIKELETTMEEAQNRLKDRLKENEIGYTADYIIKWSPRVQSRLDTTTVRTKYPEVFAECQKEITFRVMSVKGVKL